MSRCSGATWLGKRKRTAHRMDIYVLGVCLFCEESIPSVGAKLSSEGSGHAYKVELEIISLPTIPRSTSLGSL